MPASNGGTGVPCTTGQLESLHAPRSYVNLAGKLFLLLLQVAVITTRRILERVAVHYVSPRMSWKLLKGTSDLTSVRLTCDSFSI